jgi:anti-anti-sigma factor
MADSISKMFDSNTKVRTLEILGEEGQLSRVRDFVIEVCTEAGFSNRETNNTKLAVDEACTNIIKHAYDAQQGDITIKAVLRPGSVDITLTDTGKKFDFASVKDPDLDQYVESGKKGGLGVFLINRLMDNVSYRSTEAGNEITLSKKSHSAIARTMPGQISWRDSLRFKFTFRASAGLFMLMAIIAVFTLAHESRSIGEQKATQWMDRRRLAENLANKSKDLLLNPERYSLEQTNLSAYLSKLLDGDPSMAYAVVVSTDGTILSSSNIDDIFSAYTDPGGERLLVEPDAQAVWERVRSGDRFIRDIAVPVRVRDAESNRLLTLGTIHLGAYEDAVQAGIGDPRLLSLALIVGIFLIGILLIMLLVSIFVKPIQVLTDGVRAIGEGSFDGQISVEGPAEIGAIASVFNEITHKFKKAQDSILEQEKLQKEMEVAKEIQQSLLPKKMPDVSGYDIAPLYQAAAEVGGDYYDFVEVDEDTIGVVVADVSGKGVPGSLVMTMIRTALRMEARGNKNASDVMAKMNEFVTDDMKKGMFVTMFYVILDSQNRIISYASAGHNPMILYRYETNETFFLNPKGFPVGISLPDETLFRQSINVEKIKLKKDDMLLIYTDGVTEAMNVSREQYGEERLLDMIKQYGHLHPQAFIQKLETDIKKFTGGNPQNDDITIVAIKEKLGADDVLYGIRKRLIELVDTEGMSVREACLKMKVSPATYYRYKKRHELLGERGLQDKVLRKDVTLKRVSLEDRKEILAIIREHPEYGAKRIAAELNARKESPRHLTENLVYDELKRLNLNTKEFRLEHLKRYRLLSEEELKEKISPDKARKRIVEEFLDEVSKGEIRGVGAEEEVEEEAESDVAVPALSNATDFDLDVPDAEAIVQTEKKAGDITVLRINGHLDSVSTGAIERSLNQTIAGGAYKLVVDLASVSYISSGGWGIFTGQVKKLREKGGDVVLVGMTPEVYDVFELLGFGEILVSFYSMEEALDYLRMSPDERLREKESHKTAKQRIETPELLRPAADAPPEELIPGEGYLPAWESLKIEASTVGSEGNIVVLSLNGIIDTVSAETLRNALDTVVTRGIYNIVVDMSQVEYVSSGGWGTFTERLREVRRAGGDIKLFGMDPGVYYVFTMLGFNIVLSSFDILGDAIDDFLHASAKESGLHPETRQKAVMDRSGRGPDIQPADRPEPPFAPEDDAEDDISELLARAVPHQASPGSTLIKWEEPHNGILIGHLNGTIEASVIDALTHETTDLLTDQVELLVFDLSDVSYISSAGWGVFAAFHDTMSDWGGRVALSGMRASLHEIYRCLEFHTFLKSFATVQEAIGAKRPAPAQDTTPAYVEHGDEVGGTGEPEGIEDEPFPAAEEETDEIAVLDDEFFADERNDRTAEPSAAGANGERAEQSGSAEEHEEEHAKEHEEKAGIEVDRSLRDELIEEVWEKRDEPDPFVVDGADLDLNRAVSKDRGEPRDGGLRKMGWGKYGDKLKRQAAKLKHKPKKEQ